MLLSAFLYDYIKCTNIVKRDHTGGFALVTLFYLSLTGREVEMVQCPFNKSHFLRSHRIQYHIIKCKKHYKGNKVACPFNASEYIEPDEMVEHLGQCNFRVVRETHFYYSRSTTGEEIPAPFIHKNLPENDENWGIDTPDEDESDEEFYYNR